MTDEHIKQISNIGKRGECNKEDLRDLPLTTHKDFIKLQFQLRNDLVNNFFQCDLIHPLNYSLYSIEAQNVGNFIKGWHLIEKILRGAGSTSITLLMINCLSNKKEEDELYSWVAYNGGNWYIVKGERLKEMRERKSWEAEAKSRKLLLDKKLHDARVKRKIEKAKKHQEVSDKAKERYQGLKKKLQGMTDEKLVQLFNAELSDTDWTEDKGRLYAILNDEFKKRGIGISYLKKKPKFPFQKIKIVENKLGGKSIFCSSPD